MLYYNLEIIFTTSVTFKIYTCDEMRTDIHYLNIGERICKKTTCRSKQITKYVNIANSNLSGSFYPNEIYDIKDKSVRGILQLVFLVLDLIQKSNPHSLNI